MAQGARQRKDLATARQERREAASSESRRGRAGIGAPAPTPEERRIERLSGATRQECRGRRCTGAAVAAVQLMGQCPGSPVPARHPATYFPWRRRSGGGRRGSRLAGVAVGVAGRQHRAVAEVVAVVAARCRACSPHCAWYPPRWVLPEREHGLASPGAGAMCRLATPGQGLTSSLCAIRRGPGCSAAPCPRCL